MKNYPKLSKISLLLEGINMLLKAKKKSSKMLDKLA